MTDLMRKIDEKTSVSFKILVPIVTAIVAAALWINNTLQEIKSGVNSAWTDQSMQEWTQELRDRNRTMDVPYPSDFTASQRRVAAHRPR